MPERLQLSERYESMRGYFAHELHGQMIKDKNIWVVLPDLGYGMFDAIRKDFPERVIQVGAAEQAALGIAIGLAFQDKIPVVYTITPFLLYRGFETIRNYIDHEQIPVKLIGSGRNRDYEHDGLSHWAEEDKEVMKIFNNIEARWPNTKEEIPDLVEEMIKIKKPYYLNLRK